MHVRKWLPILLFALMALPACDKKVEKADDNEAEASATGEQTEEQSAGSAAAEAEEGADAEQEAEEDAAVAADVDPALLDPSAADETAPDSFKARFETTRGDFVIEFHRAWAPHGVDRAFNLIKIGYFDGIAFFRVVENFMAQFGIHDHPAVNKAWEEANIEADPVEKSNTRARVTFAQKSDPDTRKSDPTTRTTHLFINYQDNSALDAQQFAPVGEVVEGMEVVDKLYAGYGSGPPTGPDQKQAMEKGKAYLDQNFPRLDRIKNAEIVDE